MNLDDLLKGLAADGQLHSSGAFSLSLEQLISSFSQSLWVQPKLAPLFVVAAATRSGASQLEVQETTDRWVFRFHLAEPDLGGQVATQARWLLLAMAAQGQACELLCPSQGRKLSLRGRSCSVSAWKPEPADVLLSLVVHRPGKSTVLTDQLRRHCALCPLPLVLHGERLQKDLTLAYRGSPLAWSPGVPDLFRPPGPAELESPLALFIAHSRATQPTWVAVVGGISYPFQLPEARGRVGVIWCDDLRTDLSLGSVIQDEAWESARREVLRLLCGASWGQSPSSP